MMTTEHIKDNLIEWLASKDSCPKMIDLLYKWHEDSRSLSLESILKLDLDSHTFIKLWEQSNGDLGLTTVMNYADDGLWVSYILYHKDVKDNDENDSSRSQLALDLGD